MVSRLRAILIWHGTDLGFDLVSGVNSYATFDMAPDPIAQSRDPWLTLFSRWLNLDLRWW